MKKKILLLFLETPASFVPFHHLTGMPSGLAHHGHGVHRLVTVDGLWKN
jgi:hypothetical protein